MSLQRAIEQDALLAEVTGTLSEFQLTQLRNWPRLVVQTAEEWSVSFAPGEREEPAAAALGNVVGAILGRRDLPWRRPPRLTVRAERPSYEREPDGLRERLGALSEWVRTLLGKDTELVVLVDGVQFWPGEPTEPVGG